MRVTLVLTWLLMVVRMMKSHSVQYDLTITLLYVCELSTATLLWSASCQSSITDTKVGIVYILCDEVAIYCHRVMSELTM